MGHLRARMGEIFHPCKRHDKANLSCVMERRKRCLSNVQNMRILRI